MHIGSISQSFMSSMTSAAAAAKTQSIKGDGASLAGATSEYMKIPGQALNALKNAFGPRAEQMLALTAMG
jgi:hypothetical protein